MARTVSARVVKKAVRGTVDRAEGAISHLAIVAPIVLDCCPNLDILGARQRESVFEEVDLVLLGIEYDGHLQPHVTTVKLIVYTIS